MPRERGDASSVGWCTLLDIAASRATWWTTPGSLWSPGAAAPSQTRPSFCAAAGLPCPCSPPRYLIRETFVGSWAQTQSYSDDRAGTSNDGAVQDPFKGLMINVYFFTESPTWKLYQCQKFEHCTGKGPLGSVNPVPCCQRQAHHKVPLWVNQSLY